MKKLGFLLLVLILADCNNERILKLPEIENADLSEVLDVSPAYVFYDVTQADSTLFNRKNLIGTTNWLVNVDKRLTLRQAIPHIQYLQQKRRKASMHKNEDAKNYFTCNDTSIGNLGFIEFTNVNYLNDADDLKLFLKNQTKDIILLRFRSSLDVSVEMYRSETGLIEKKHKTTIGDAESLNTYLKTVQTTSAVVLLHSEMSFQDYIEIKIYLLGDSINFLDLSETEIIY